MTEIPEPWRQVLQAARAGSRDVILLQRCSRSGGSLHFNYVRTERARVSVRCVSCPRAAASEQITSEPPWVGELGPDVTTQQGYRSNDTRNQLAQPDAPSSKLVVNWTKFATKAAVRGFTGRFVSRARMCLVVSTFEALRGDVSINLGGGEVRMTEELLNAAQVGASVQHVGGIAMPELVRG